MIKSFLSLLVAALLAVPCAHAQGRHGGGNFAAARGSFRHGGDSGRYHGRGRNYYFRGVSYPFFGLGFGYPYYDYGYGVGYNEAYGYGYPSYGPGAYEGRIVQDSAHSSPSLPAVVQKQLARKGYYKGTIDGQFGPASRNALERFQHANGLNATGRIDEPSLMALGFSDHR